MCIKFAIDNCGGLRDSGGSVVLVIMRAGSPKIPFFINGLDFGANRR